VKTYYFTGPGGWAYSVTGTAVTAIWSPSSRRAISKPLSAATSAAVLSEVLFYYPSAAEAVANAQANAPSAAPAATGLTSYLPAMPGFLSSTPTTTPAPGAGAGADTGTKITDQPWFVPAVIGGLGLLAVLAFSQPSKAKAAAPSSRYAGLF
jgi:hypothetical protein